jgi:hypothetical protein
MIKATSNLSNFRANFTLLANEPSQLAFFTPQPNNIADLKVPSTIEHNPKKIQAKVKDYDYEAIKRASLNQALYENEPQEVAISEDGEIKSLASPKLISQELEKLGKQKPIVSTISATYSNSAISDNVTKPVENSEMINNLLSDYQKALTKNPSKELYQGYLRLLRKVLKSLNEQIKAYELIDEIGTDGYQTLDNQIKNFAQEIKRVEIMMGYIFARSEKIAIDKQELTKSTSSLSKTNKLNITQELEERFYVGKLTAREEEECKALKQKVIAAVQECVPCKENLELIFHDMGSDLEFECFQGKNSERFYLDATYLLLTEVILLNTNNINRLDELKRLTNHELIHASRGILHKNDRCVTSISSVDILGLSLTSPILPATEENLAKYNKALDAGDNRILKFQKLWIKKNVNQQSLTFREEELLRKYEVAAKDCLSFHITLIISQEIYHRLGSEYDFKDWIVIPEANYYGKVKVKIVEYDKDKNHYTLDFVPFNPVISLIYLVDHVQYSLDNYIYQGFDNFNLLAEREAYTLEVLTRKARKVFYPEVDKLFQIEKSKCLVKGNKDNSKTLNKKYKDEL